MENTTMTKGIDPMIASRMRIRIERSQPARFLAPVMGEAWGTTLSAGAHVQAIQGGNAGGCAFGYAPAATDRIVTTPVITTLTTPFMDVDDLRSGRPPV